MQQNVLTVYDWFLVPFYLFFIFLIARFIRNLKIDKYPEYKYYLTGLAAKIFGAMFLALIYTLYYGGGDTVAYFEDGLCWNKLLFENPAAFVRVFSEGTNAGNYFYFSESTGYPTYWRSPETNYVVRFSFLAVFLGARSFLIASILFAVVSFEGIWRLYRIYVSEFPNLIRGLSIAFLFIPSVIFWGSGILKDTITISCVGYFFSSFYYIIFNKKKILTNVFIIFISMYLILKLKPYIFVALMPGITIWSVNQYLARVGGSFTKLIITPVFLTLAVISAYVVFSLLSKQLKDYSLENVMEKAVVTQRDLKADYYRGNAFDIGEIEPTVESFLSHSHLAINAALFRPYLWEANNIVMILSGLENLWFLIFTLIVLYRTRIFGFLTYFTKHHLLTFALVFSLFFAFAVGISTSNFGSMVRYRIPILPFYISSLYIINHYQKIKRQHQLAMNAG